MDRRTFVLSFTALSAAFAASSATAAVTETQARKAQRQLAQLEKNAGGHLGVYAINTGNGEQITHRPDERFPLCSTFKVMAAAAILARSVQNKDLLQQRIHYTASDLVSYSPITEKHVREGMTVSELCAAALRYSDNTAGNLMIDMLGGPANVTAYARSIGDHAFRLDRRETALNTALPGDPRDTTTPSAMAHSLQKLLLGDALPVPQRQQLATWLRGNTTGGKRIRAALPAGWVVGDKTGSGDYGVTNDIAVFWPPEHQPVILAIYYRQDTPKAKWRDDVIVAATQIVLRGFGLAQ